MTLWVGDCNPPHRHDGQAPEAVSVTGLGPARAAALTATFVIDLRFVRCGFH
jgi:hypothetical protein